MKQLAIAAVLVAAFVSSVQAQSYDLRATIPFEFRVDKTLMPAGEYVIHRQAPGVFILWEERSHHAVMTSHTVGELHAGRLNSGELEFNRYGETYFLAKVWAPYSTSGIALLTSPLETELARASGVTQRASIALQRK